jgi:hypothetical protein
VWVFDVDGTLVGSVLSDRLRPGVAELLALLQASRTTLVAWSAGGADYACRMLTQFALDRHFCAYYDKASRGADGRYLLDHLDPAHRPGTLVDDFPDEVPEAPRVIRVRQFLGSNPNDTGLTDAIRIARERLSR